MQRQLVQIDQTPTLGNGYFISSHKRPEVEFWFGRLGCTYRNLIEIEETSRWKSVFLWFIRTLSSRGGRTAIQAAVHRIVEKVEIALSNSRSTRRFLS